VRRIPETADRADWPRLVAQTLNRALIAIEALRTAVIGLIDDVADLQTDLGTAQGDISALQTATDWSSLVDAADDTAAATAGVEINEFYRTGSTIKVRVS